MVFSVRTGQSTERRSVRCGAVSESNPQGAASTASHEGKRRCHGTEIVHSITLCTGVVSVIVIVTITIVTIVSATFKLFPGISQSYRGFQWTAHRVHENR